MPASPDDPAEIQRAYSRAFWTVVGHAVFVAVCCIGVVMVRRFFRLPSALLGVVFIVALIVFGSDIIKFLRARDRLRQLDPDS